jgi:hypothetical protein
MKYKSLYIIVIIALIVVIGCQRREEVIEEEVVEPVVEEEVEPVDDLRDPIDEREPRVVREEDKIYELQLVSLKDYSRVALEKDILEMYGYKTKIVPAKVRGETYYRLRMNERYTKEEAEDLGEELKARFASIQAYWIEKVK